MRVVRRILALSMLISLVACTGLRVVENTPSAITVRYDGVETMDDVTAAANKACAAHGKTAKLRKTETRPTLLRHFVHFDCVGQ
jgi:hypothetical protein